VPEVNAFLASAILALVIGLVTSALQIAGIVSVNVARVCLFAAWMIAIIGVCGSMEHAPARHLVIAAIVTGVPLAISFVVLERWISHRIGKPKLYGEIICIEDETHFDQRDNDYDCFITLCVEVRNSETPTAVTTFSLDLWWRGQDHPGTHEPLDGYVVQTYGREPDPRIRRVIRNTPLKDFPCGEEITKTNYKNGWVRFSFGALPPEMVDGDQLAKDVVIELAALDNQRKPHPIFKGTLYKSPVERMAGCGKIVRRELKLY
jgi:hypothetical protein